MNIYFSGIGGVGIGPLIQIARDAGHVVAGSDLRESLMTKQLETEGIRVIIGQDGTKIAKLHAEQPIDWFVYTASIDEGRPELEFCEQHGIRTSKRDELLAHIIAEKNLKLIAVAGTHGKTTTTGMMVWTLKQLGIPMSYSVGTTLSWGPSGKFDPASEYFVYECDEFDRNFLHFSPYLSLITSIEYDHPDTYPTKQAYFDAFTQFAAQSDQVIMWQHDATNITVPEHSWLLSDQEVQDISLAGVHNRRNASLVAKAIEFLAKEERIHGKDEISEILASFPGTNRRFEKLAENLYTDYGHTPTEIAATLQMARELSDHVVLVYQPHQNIRQHEIRDQYTDDIFKDADEVYWLPTYLSREDKKLEILTPEELTKDLSNVHIAELNDESWNHVQKARNDGKLVLCMGAGSIDSWLRSKLTK